MKVKNVLDNESVENENKDSLKFNIQNTRGKVLGR